MKMITFVVCTHLVKTLQLSVYGADQVIIAFTYETRKFTIESQMIKPLDSHKQLYFLKIENSL